MSKYKLKQDVLAQKVLDEMVILEPETGEYFTLNGVGTDMVKMIEQGSSEDDIILAITSKFDVTEREVREDYRNLLKQLIEQGLIEEH